MLGVCLALAPGARAATVSAPAPIENQGTSLTVNRANGEDNDLLLEQGKSHRTLVRERGDAPLRADGSCEQASKGSVVCPPVGSTLTLDLGTGSDAAIMHLRGVVTVTADGGDGDDVIAVAGLSELSHVTLRGGRGSDTLRGAVGRDLILGGAGPDRLSGRRGSDVLFGDGEHSSADHDQIRGGSGFDYAKWSDRHAPVRVDLRGGGSGGTEGEDDALDSIEAAVGGQAGDVLIGDGGRNLLRGGPGPDILRGRGDSDHLEGGPGPDDLSAGGGNDAIDTGGDGDAYDDAAADAIRCADGRDTVIRASDDGARADLIPQSCELVSAVYLVAVPRLRLGAERVIVEVRCNAEGGKRRVRLISRGVELGRGQTGAFCDHHGVEVEVPLDDPLAPGPPIRVVIDGENVVFPPPPEPFHTSYRLSRPDA